eukprot:XP_017947247.1 PREDICTED: glycerophosphodiester phosphodiesterase domain-containing protein 5-like [Xenopus tropicalis]
MIRLGKLKVVRRRLLQRYEHQPFVSLLAGLYSCRWKRYQRQKTEPGQCCCKLKEHLFFMVVLVAFCLSLIFLYFWQEAKNDYNDFDWISYLKVGYWFLWSTVVLVVAAVLFGYIALLLVLAVCLLSEGQQLHLHWSHKIGTVIVLVVSLGALVALSHLWKGEWDTVRLSFQVTAPYLHIAAIAAMSVLSWPVALYFMRMSNAGFRVLILSPYLAVLLFLYLIPLGMYSPCIREEGTLGPKPKLIGHRGSPTECDPSFYWVQSAPPEHLKEQTVEPSRERFWQGKHIGNKKKQRDQKSLDQINPFSIGQLPRFPALNFCQTSIQFLFPI